MHADQAPKGGRVNYAEGPKPLEFDSIYSPREGLVAMGKLSKNYWRTRDNIDYYFFEARAQKLIIVCCQDMNSTDKRALKTVAVNMEMLYATLDAKKRESEEPIYKKAERGFESDADLHKAALAYLEQRLVISKEPSNS